MCSGVPMCEKRYTHHKMPGDWWVIWDRVSAVVVFETQDYVQSALRLERLSEGKAQEQSSESK